eukprot:CAMPEP_0185775980 /NCGR_PEP_ID=MMETSP1174-20130828/83966_1 /TAXON_ID=35687 /ORGANISM="Dictyocha speculum, Strain CCMP1381" /LENGTH=197 /DNA_ID=CAMNT_0028463729 /DNA_START=115 /DNA_END=708 /DNA_ORIENTATION=-
MTSQGFASGDSERDGSTLRQLVNDGHHVMLAQSFAKSFGLYNDRIGALSMVTASEDQAARMVGQLKRIIRASYSNPPAHGARIVKTILGNPELHAQWQNDCRAMAARINGMRALLRQSLEASGSLRSWDHITSQIGMFAYTGLTREEVMALQEDYSIYMTMDGRISMAGVNPSNAENVARAIHGVTSSPGGECGVVP